jgi:hypothetical protein
VIPIGGFSQWPKIEDAAWTFENILRSEVKLAALFDRDYRPEEEIGEFVKKMRQSISLCFVLERKELENYLLQPDAIARALSRRLEERGSNAVVNAEEVRIWLTELTATLEKAVSAQCYAHRLRYYAKAGLDQSTISHESLEWFETQWGELDARLAIVPGKAVLSALNQRLQQEYQLNLTHAMITAAMAPQAISRDLTEILQCFEEFATVVA